MKVLPVALAALLFALPLAASAQAEAPTQDDAELRASIQSALLSDPRTDQLAPEQLNALITALAADAVAHNIKPNDISYTPRVATDFGVATLANDTQQCPLFPCAFGEAYGFNGGDPTTPVLLLASSGALWLIFRRMMRPQHAAHFLGTIPTVPSPTPGAPNQYV